LKRCRRRKGAQRPVALCCPERPRIFVIGPLAGVNARPI
jgi:hypothetical protein